MPIEGVKLKGIVDIDRTETQTERYIENLGALTINDLIKMQDKEVLGEKSPTSSVLIYDPKSI